MGDINGKMKMRKIYTILVGKPQGKIYQTPSNTYETQG
jgi:hypothetical protein